MVLNEDIVPYVIENRNIEAEEDDDLTEEQIKDLEEAMREVDRREWISYEEFKLQMDEWRTRLKSASGSK